MTFSIHGKQGGGYAAGPAQNIFEGVDLADAQSIRDTYFAANPTKLAAYDSNPFYLIRLVYPGETRAEYRGAGAWVDYTPFLQGQPGEVASLVNVPVGELPYKKLDGTFGGSRMRVLDDGSLLAPPGFGVESGSVKFGDVLLLSEAAGFLSISNLINDRNYTVLDYYTPPNAASAVPSAFMADAPAFSFVAQADDSVNLSATPLIFDYTIQNTSRTYSLFMRAYAPMTNVRIKITQVSNNVTLKYVPSKEVWETGTGGLSWNTGDNTFNFGETPLILRTGQAVRFEIEATAVHLKGNASGITYFGGLDQLGTFRDVLMADQYTATDVRDKLTSLVGAARLDVSAIKNSVTSVAGRTGAVVLSASDVSGLATVATTGAYSSLSGLPTIPTNTNQLTNGANFITAAQAPVQSVQGRTGAVIVTATDVGLGNVDNTSDINKPTSTAQQASIDAKMAQHNANSDPHPQYTTTAEASAAAPVQSVNGNTGTVVLTTGNISEVGNLYYTDARVATYITGAGYNVKSASSLGAGAAVYSGNVSGDIRFRSIIGTGAATVTQNTNDITINVPAATVASVNGQTGTVVLTTTNIAEGTNLYYTDSRVTSYLASSGYTVKSITSGGAGSSMIASQSLGAVTLRSVIGTGIATVTQNSNDITINVPANAVSSVNGQTGAVILNSSNIAEVTNLYYTDARVGTYLTTNGYVVKTLASVGAGSSLVANVGPSAQIRSVIGTGAITVTQNTNDITINHTVASSGAGASVFNATTSGATTLRSIIGTGQATATQNANDITINVPAATVTSVANTGSGSGVFNSNTAGAVGLRSINGTGLITVTQNTNDITVSAPLITGGTYTPTVANSANTSATTAYACQYMRVDGTVTVSGKVDIDPVTNGTQTRITMTLPIASALTTQQQVGGVATCIDQAQVAGIYADTAGDRAFFEFLATSTTNRSFYFTFTYQVV